MLCNLNIPHTSRLLLWTTVIYHKIIRNLSLCCCGKFRWWQARRFLSALVPCAKASVTCSTVSCTLIFARRTGFQKLSILDVIVVVFSTGINLLLSSTKYHLLLKSLKSFAATPTCFICYPS